MHGILVLVNSKQKAIHIHHTTYIHAVLVRSSRVIGDWGRYRRLMAYLAVFGREGAGQKCGGKGGCIDIGL
jgi:hypothetical protein